MNNFVKNIYFLVIIGYLYSAQASTTCSNKNECSNINIVTVHKYNTNYCTDEIVTNNNFGTGETTHQSCGPCGVSCYGCMPYYKSISCDEYARANNIIYNKCNSYNSESSITTCSTSVTNNTNKLTISIYSVILLIFITILLF